MYEPHMKRQHFLKDALLFYQGLKLKFARSLMMQKGDLFDGFLRFVVFFVTGDFGVSKGCGAIRTSVPTQTVGTRMKG